MLWLFPMFQDIANTQSSFVAFIYYLVGIAVLSHLIGKTFSKGFESMIVFLVLVIAFDVVSPPMIIQRGIVPTQDVLNTWGSDTFLYQISTNYLSFGHEWAWGFVYLFTPFISVVIMAYFLSGKKLNRKLMVILNSE